MTCSCSLRMGKTGHDVRLAESLLKLRLFCGCSANPGRALISLNLALHVCLSVSLLSKASASDQPLDAGSRRAFIWQSLHTCEVL